MINCCLFKKPVNGRKKEPTQCGTPASLFAPEKLTRHSSDLGSSDVEKKLELIVSLEWDKHLGLFLSFSREVQYCGQHLPSQIVLPQSD